MDRNQCIAKLQQHEDVFSKQYKVHSMKLFGSVARGEQTEHSDVDILVDMQPNMYMLVGLKQYLEQLLQCPVDVLRQHRNMDSYLVNQINHDSITIFS